jgi:hypothetical protein
MDRKSTTALGTPDFVVFMEARVLLIECKSRMGKSSMAQLAWQHHAQKLGWTVHVIRSFEAFLEIVKGA